MLMSALLIPLLAMGIPTAPTTTVPTTALVKRDTRETGQLVKVFSSIKLCTGRINFRLLFHLLKISFALIRYQ